MVKLVLATGNSGKVTELSDLLSDYHIEVLSMNDYSNIEEPKETGETFAENAIIKAENVANATGELALADDSGLEVDVLNGEPGVYSARYAGDSADDQDNNNKLLRSLADISLENRTAKFKSVIALAHPNITTLTFSGICHGYIIDEPRGERGFGYDPLFYFPETDKTFAEMSGNEKSLISHRGRALRKLINSFDEILTYLEG